MARSRSRPTSRPSRRAAAAPRWAAVRLFAMDVDGVLTDGAVFVFSDGTEAKRFSVLDGLGLARLRDAGVVLAWISGRASAATARRAEELRIPHLIQGRTDKQAALAALATQLGFEAAQVAYMGDDEIDIPALAWAGIGIAPRDALPAVRAAADHVTRRAAGHGAVREICDLIRAHRPEAAEQTARHG